MTVSAESAKPVVERALPGVALSLEGQALVVQPRDVPRVAQALKASAELQLDYLSSLTAVDYPPDPAGGTGRIDVIYHLYSMAKKHGPVELKVALPRATPRVPSLTPLYRGAEFQEREAYDLFGVIFEGHPDLRRILMWEGFEGHPMRKDYVVEDQDAA